jgi:hypothetical protein
MGGGVPGIALHGNPALLNSALEVVFLEIEVAQRLVRPRALRIVGDGLLQRGTRLLALTAQAKNKRKLAKGFRAGGLQRKCLLHLRDGLVQIALLHVAATQPQAGARHQGVTVIPLAGFHPRGTPHSSHGQPAEMTGGVFRPAPLQQILRGIVETPEAL